MKFSLDTQAQRALLAVGCLGLMPWFAFRIVAGTWQVWGIKNYFDYAFIQPFAPWFESGWWWYTMLNWYDWPNLPSFALICTALLWPLGPARLFDWIKGKQ